MQPNVTKKRKCEDDITQSVFQCRTVQEFAVAKAVVNNFNVKSVNVHVKAAKKNASISINTSLQDLEILPSFSQIPVTLDIEAGEKPLPLKIHVSLL